MTVIAMTMRGSASISPRSMARLTTRYRHAAKMVSTPPTDHGFPERFRDAGVAHAHRRTRAGRHLAHPQAESRNHESQTHHGDASPYPGEKCSLVGENLGLDLVRVEPSLFVLTIRHLLGSGRSISYEAERRRSEQIRPDQSEQAR
jgi:hypothetical protein